MRIREIIVLGSFAPITIFSTKFTDSLTGNAKLAGFSLTVTLQAPKLVARRQTLVSL